MFASPTPRAAGVLVLLGLLFGLAVWYGSLPPEPTAGDLPSEADLIRNYDRYVGDRVVVDGSVVGVDPVVIEISDGVETRRITVHNPPPGASLGDSLAVYGVAREGHTIRAIDEYTVPTWGLWYTFTISFVAGLWVLTRLIRHWRVSVEEVGLIPRSTSHSTREWPFDRSSPTDEDVDTDA